MKTKVVNIVYEFFAESNDFNGITISELSNNLQIPDSETIDNLIDLVKKNKISIQSGENPHIIRLGHYTIEQQVELLNDARNNKKEVMWTIPHPDGSEIEVVSESHKLCVYPSEEFLKSNRDITIYSTKPFTQELALGKPHLTPLFFELNILERYYNDPRYVLDLDDYSGKISYATDEQHKPLHREENQVFLSSFGLGVDENDNRIIVAYLTYLHHLTPEHQGYWQTNRIYNGCRIYEEYYKNTALGQWTNSVSEYTAFLGELDAVISLTESIFEKSLFRESFSQKKRPQGFNFLLLPTSKNYEDFVLLLDKMISENINHSFFEGKIDTFSVTKNEDGTQTRTPKGTLTMLEEWLRKIFNTPEQNKLNMIFEAFKKIRKERQAPAHKIKPNEFNHTYIAKQRDLMHEAYQAMLFLRDIFKLHPKSSTVNIPDWLDRAVIKPF